MCCVCCLSASTRCVVKDARIDPVTFSFLPGNRALLLVNPSQSSVVATQNYSLQLTRLLHASPYTWPTAVDLVVDVERGAAAGAGGEADAARGRD